jgi:5-methylcytosine-specific restriction endonuclease McrA
MRNADGMDERLPTPEQITHAIECNAWMQRTARTDAASKRTARQTPIRARWRAADPQRWQDYIKRAGQRRNERRKAARDGVPDEILEAADDRAREILTAEPFVCTYCHQEIPAGTARTVDHITPLSRGGKHTPGNLTPACKSCNSRKHSRLRYPHPSAPPIPLAR